MGTRRKRERENKHEYKKESKMKKILFILFIIPALFNWVRCWKENDSMKKNHINNPLLQVWE